MLMSAFSPELSRLLSQVRPLVEGDDLLAAIVADVSETVRREVAVVPSDDQPWLDPGVIEMRERVRAVVGFPGHPGVVEARALAAGRYCTEAEIAVDALARAIATHHPSDARGVGDPVATARHALRRMLAKGLIPAAVAS